MALQDGGGGAGAERKERSRDPLVGSVVNGKFHIHKAIARGGMGRIYYGTQAPLDRPVAVKVVKADSVNEDESQFLKRFLLEASILAKLQHPNVVTLFDYGRIENHPVEMYFIAMEYLDGETLGERLRTRGALATTEALALFRQIGRGLREAHTRGIVHRDLKPSNIVIVPESDGEIVKLVDFGIGKIERSGEDLTRDGVLVGTPKYMAPEQFDGDSSPASDVYALGIIMFQLLTGTVPFAGNTMAEFMIAKLQHAVPSLREANPICDATENVENLVYRMLARRPEERPTLDEVFALLSVCEDEIFGSSGARLAMTGSRANLGFPNSSRSSVGALQVPYTVVAPQPVVPGLTPRPGRHPGGLHITGSGQVAVPMMSGSTPPPMAMTGFTPRPMATSAFPSGIQQKPTSLPVSIVIAIVFAIGTAGAAGLWFAKTRMMAGKEQPATTASVPSVTPSPAEVSTSFTLHLESSPTGAVVTEDGRMVGTTPVNILIDRASVATVQRNFQIKKDGYVATAFVQGRVEATQMTVETTVQLAPDAARTVKSPPHVVGAPKPPSTGAKTPPGTPTGDPDIRLKR